MKHYLEHCHTARNHLLLLALVTSLALPLPALAASVALATSPLATSTTSSVKPNVLFILDDSGSMGWEFMPDSVNGNNGMNCYRNNHYNGVYYNPDLTYDLPVYADGTPYPNSDFYAAKTNGFSGITTNNLSSQFMTGNDSAYTAAYYYKYTGSSPATPVAGTCYANTSYTRVTVSSTSGPSGTDERQNFANWYTYYRNRMLTMKTAAGRAFSSLNNSYRVGLMKISNSTSPVVALDTYETTHRNSWYSTLYSINPTSSTPLREALSNAGKYYAGKLGGTDPLQYSCQQNFTILSTDGYWNGNAGSRLDGSAVDNQDGTAARPMYDGAQAGTTVTITYTRNDYSKVSTGCSGSQRRLKTQPQIGSCSVSVTGTPTGSESCTPASWANNGAATYGICMASSSVVIPSPDPSVKVESSRITTSGTVGGSSDSLADVAMYYYATDLRTSALNNCGTPVAPATVGPLCENNVFIGGNDNNLQQHMTSFTLGLGANGRMKYSSSYLSDSTGDYVAVKLGSPASSTVCTWQTAGTVCNWPTPASSAIENIDDLWHAAVNGRGAYFSASDPSALTAGLNTALAGINARKGSAAAAATSTLNPVAGNNFAYVASYTTVAWKGNLEARGINTDTGEVSENATWCVENVPAGTCASPGVVVAETSGDTTIYNCVTPNAVICTGGTMVGTDCMIPVATACTGTMNAKVSDASDTRTIKTANNTGTALIDFDAAYAAANPSYFSAAHIGTLSQWSSLTATQQTAAGGVNLVNYLRGQYGHEDRSSNLLDDRLYRYREAVLGDALESQPAFISKPVFSYPYAGYTDFKTLYASRAGTVYMGANDGMMHAFAGDTGIERWAYVPSMVIPNMWKLADMNYATMHVNLVNGSPITSDVCVANCTDAIAAIWKTILVAGLNGGGRGYYALDITNPSAPALLWEFTTTAGIGSIKDDDVGYSFGQPIITRKADGTWVVLVTSGYNNTSPGDGKGYLYVLNAGTGAIISKISSGVGSTATPSGLAKIAAYNEEPAGNKAGYVYGGDLLGNVWRFNINSTVAATMGTGEAFKFATLFSEAAGTNPQPITTAPILGKINEKRVIFIGTGKYLETGDLTTTQTQTMYAILDDDATATFTNPRNTLVQQTIINNPDGTATRLAGTSNAVNFYTGRGWYVDFPDSGERVNIEGKLVQGILIVASIVPSNTACSPGGYGWLNFFDYKNGSAISEKFDATIVGVNVIYVQGEPVIKVVTSRNPTPETPTLTAPFSGTQPSFSSKRVIWRELIP